MPVTPGFFDFLVENRLHDSKAWFEEHRKEYQRLVLEPLRGLVTEMTPVMLELDPQLVVQPAVGKTISRIFRDTRFSRDKSAFREHLWISFSRAKAERFQPVPELWFDLAPDGYSYGCGWYCPGTQLMETLRRLVLEGDKTAKAAGRRGPAAFSDGRGPVQAPQISRRAPGPPPLAGPQGTVFLPGGQRPGIPLRPGPGQAGGGGTYRPGPRLQAVLEGPGHRPGPDCPPRHRPGPVVRISL